MPSKVMIAVASGHAIRRRLPDRRRTLRPAGRPAPRLRPQGIGEARLGRARASTGSSTRRRRTPSTSPPTSCRRLLANEYGLDRYYAELQRCLDLYIKQHPLLEQLGTFRVTESPSMQHYRPGGGFKTAHFERANFTTTTRMLVCMTYLNDVKDGGGTHFVYQKHTFEARRGRRSSGRRISPTPTTVSSPRPSTSTSLPAGSTSSRAAQAMSLDRFIGEFDRALRAIAGVANAARVSPAEGSKPKPRLDERERAPRGGADAGEPRRRGLRAGALPGAGADRARSRMRARRSSRRRARSRTTWRGARNASASSAGAEPAQSALVRRVARHRRARRRAGRSLESRVSRRDRAPGRGAPRAVTSSGCRRATSARGRSSKPCAPTRPAPPERRSDWALRSCLRRCARRCASPRR